jgi:hypothetical protein
MFRNNTVFILGAGASWHYGYPTGEKLVKDVIDRCTQALGFFEGTLRQDHNFPRYLLEKCSDPLSLEQRVGALRSTIEECKELRSRLRQVDPLVIDYFLGQNPKLQDIGKLMIAWVILDADAKYQKNRANQNRSSSGKDNWYRFLLNKLAANCKQSSDLHNNDVSFITFNYDVSLEHTLYDGLSSIELFKKEDINKFFSESRVTHVYGKVRNCPPNFKPLNIAPTLGFAPRYVDRETEYMAEYRQLLDDVFDASKTIRVIDPHDKETDNQQILIARTMLTNAKLVYILGYGFDENNSARLELRERIGHPKRKAILFTNFGDINRVNKRASQVFLGSSGEFSPSHPIIRGSLREGFYYEKSVRDVYEALEFDFDALEEAQEPIFQRSLESRG